MKHTLLILGLVLGACTSEPEEDPSTEQSLLGHWEEVPPEGIFFFAGSRLDFEITGDGVTLEDSLWTDAVGCHLVDGAQKCADYRWKNRYQAKLSRTGSLLVIDYTFKETTANELTETQAIASGQGRFKVTFIDAGNSLVLENTGAEPFLGNRTKIVLRLKKD